MQSDPDGHEDPVRQTSSARFIIFHSTGPENSGKIVLCLKHDQQSFFHSLIMLHKRLFSLHSRLLEDPIRLVFAFTTVEWSNRKLERRRVFKRTTLSMMQPETFWQMIGFTEAKSVSTIVAAIFSVRGACDRTGKRGSVKVESDVCADSKFHRD